MFNFFKEQVNKTIDEEIRKPLAEQKKYREKQLCIYTLNSVIQKVESKDYRALSQNGRNRLGPKYAELILNELPEQVKAYQHSEEFSEVRAEREIGEEKWDVSNVNEWIDTL